MIINISRSKKNIQSSIDEEKEFLTNYLKSQERTNLGLNTILNKSIASYLPTSIEASRDYYNKVSPVVNMLSKSFANVDNVNSLIKKLDTIDIQSKTLSDEIESYNSLYMTVFDRMVKDTTKLEQYLLDFLNSNNPVDIEAEEETVNKIEIKENDETQIEENNKLDFQLNDDAQMETDNKFDTQVQSEVQSKDANIVGVQLQPEVQSNSVNNQVQDEEQNSFENIQVINEKQTEVDTTPNIKNENIINNNLKNNIETVKKLDNEPETKVEIAQNEEDVSLDNKETLNQSPISLDENVLLVSEIEDKVVLPYTRAELDELLLENPAKYKSIKEIIDTVYTRPLKYYKHSSFMRFKEAYNLVKREHGSTLHALDLGLELFSNYNLHPAVISACKNLDQLDIYLSCLQYNELNDFRFFKTIFKVNPLLSKHVIN